MKARLLSCLLFVCACSAAPKTQLINKNLDGWERICDGVWSVTREGVLIGERDLSQPAPKTDPSQAWLYTKKEYGEYDLHVEWWTRLRGNSGISLRDGTRGRYSCGAEADPKRTPSHIGYEIQISNGYKDKYPSGSIYLFQPAKPGFEYPNDWNAMDLEVRNNLIRVKLNGHIVAEHAGDPTRSKTGPIGLQLHDHNSLVMFRNMWIQEVTGPKK